jgi:hypothetical protein
MSDRPAVWLYIQLRLQVEGLQTSPAFLTRISRPTYHHLINQRWANMQLTPIASLLLFTLTASGHVARDDSCSNGVLDQGYCCKGSIFQKEHNSDYSAGNMICCEGDPSTQIATGPDAPTSCTVGTEVPLTQVSGAGSTESATSTSATASPAAITPASNAVRKSHIDVSMMCDIAALGGAALIL